MRRRAGQAARVARDWFGNLPGRATTFSTPFRTTTTRAALTTALGGWREAISGGNIDDRHCVDLLTKMRCEVVDGVVLLEARVDTKTSIDVRHLCVNAVEVEGSVVHVAVVKVTQTCPIQC